MYEMGSFCFTQRRMKATIVAYFLFVTGLNGEWVGKQCCEYAISDECRNACLQTKSKDSLHLNCREQTEVELFNCVLRHHRKKRCCGKAENSTTSCQHFCAMTFRSQSGPSDDNILAVQQHCPADVHQCTKNFSSAMRRISDEDLICCDKSNSEKCRNDCRRVMRSLLSDREKIDRLVDACGSPVPREPMWKCFISRGGESPHPAPPPVGPDLQCCSKAISPNCRRHCEKLYSRPWESSLNWKYFQEVCEYDAEESDLRICLEEVREPCKMGCDSLSFCSNFNNRPTELFHSCNIRADNIARTLVTEWSQGLIRLPLVDIPVHDIRQCQPEKWKAVACSLEIKPCSPNVGHSTICWSDCVSLLKKCSDNTRFKPGTSVEMLCDMFSPRHLQHDCISLAKYTEVSVRSNDLVKLTQPCNPNPCDDGHLCVINRNFCPGGQRCPAYKCLRGCKVGDVGDLLVNIGQRVKIPDFNRGEGCFRACACTSTGRLQHCVDLPCIDAPRTCNTVGQIKVHGSHFKIDCNFCSCYNGNVTCTKRQCKSGDVTDDNHRKYTGIPCNCEDHFIPVCAANGRTYPSTCLARCMGHTDSQIQFGPCKAKDPCDPNPCRRNERCMKASRVCVTSSKFYSCPQFECVPPYSRCMARRRTHDAYGSDGYHYVNPRRLNSASRRSVNAPMFFGYDVDANRSDPVCDTNGVEHESICHLRKKNNLAYRGHCDTTCDFDQKKPVCGQNIVTYENKCCALAERVLVDYDSECHVVRVSKEKNKPDGNCGDVTCRPLSNIDCKPITPPGACCPICGGMIRVLYSQTHVDAVAKSALKGPVTVRDILRSLRRHINVMQCDIYGHLTLEGDIVVLAVPIIDKPTLLQIEACLREAEGLGRFINERNPMMTSDVILSTLTAAEVHGGKVPISGAGSAARNKFAWRHVSEDVMDHLRRFGLLGESLCHTNSRSETSELAIWIATLASTHLAFATFLNPAGG